MNHPEQARLKALRLYARLVRKRPSVNMTHRLQIALANRMVPAQCESMLRELLATQAPHLEQGREWARQLRAMMSRMGKRRPEPFARRCIREHVTMYEGPAPQGRAAKVLLFCFSGAAQRVMMPLPVFLQCLDANEVDVVLVRYPKRASFRRGIPGIADTFEEAMCALPQLVDTAAYGRVVVLGTSGGAVPSLLFALAHKCDAVLAVGTGSPEDDRWPATLEGGPAGLARRLEAAGGSRTECVLMFGGDEPDDVRAAHAWHAILPHAHLLPVLLGGQKVGHVALSAYVFTGRLTQFMRVFLDQPGDSVRFPVES